MVINCDQIRSLQEVVVTYLKVLSQHSPEDWGKTMKHLSQDSQ